MPSAATTINIRASGEMRDLIDRAANLQNKTRTDFMLEASCRAAKQVLLDQVLFQVSEAQMAAFETAMAQPVTANEAAMKLLATKSPWDA